MAEPGAGGSGGNGEGMVDGTGDEPPLEQIGLPGVTLTREQIIWVDEFDGTVLNEDNWNVVHEAWPHNEELEFYTNRPKNVRVEDGFLVLEVHEEQFEDRGYTSGRIDSSGKQVSGPGVVMARIELPRAGSGLWPAFWMMGADRHEPGGGWPDSGEIDIMEHKGSQPTRVSGALHAPGYFGATPIHGEHVSETDLQGSFHEYGILWTDTSIEWFVDGQSFYKVLSTEVPGPWIFNDQPFFVLLNLAVGGFFDGDPTESTQFPAQMRVDWVRAFELPAE